MIFDDYQWIHFQSLLVSLLLTPFKPTLCEMAKVLGFGTHRSKHNAFIINSSVIIGKALQFYAYVILSLFKKMANQYILFSTIQQIKKPANI